MKAAVIQEFGRAPVYSELPEPHPGPGEQLLNVRAAAWTRLARGMAEGHHYAGPATLPSGLGADAVGLLPDGRRVYASGPRPPNGTMQQRTVVPQDRCLPVPTGLSDAVAAALPNAAFASWFALAYRARLQPGESVLVLGATGAAGRLAFPIARHFGAGRLVGAGRNEEALAKLPGLGADATVSLRQADEAIVKALDASSGGRPYDVVVDFLWGRTAELLIAHLLGRGNPRTVHRTRYVSVGSMAGPTATLPSAALRGSGLELLGSGIGSVPLDQIGVVLPQIWTLAEEGRLPMDLETVPLSEVASVWGREGESGRRIVLVP